MKEQIQDKNTYVLIMAGGLGSRFWPKSRKSFPKQFLDVFGMGKSLLQMTFERFSAICPRENIYILSNSDYSDLIQSQLPSLRRINILLEPSRNNTAPSIAYACYKILKLNNNANIVVAPSDHLILKEDIFLQNVKKALNFSAKLDALITLGIKPTRPDTGYGYIKFGIEAENRIYQVDSFMEKPNLSKAREYLESQRYLWNAGIFVWRAKVIVKQFEKYCPEINSLFSEGENFYNTDMEANYIASNYSKNPNISIDYAILERSDIVYTIPVDIGWSDLGTWSSFYDIAGKDLNGNVVNCVHSHLTDTSNCLIQLSGGKAAVIKGLDDYIVVEDSTVLLIYPKSDEQEIKKVAEKVALDFGTQYS